MEISADIVVVGTGVGGLFSTLWLPEEKQVVLITKSDLESSDSFLAQEESAYSEMKRITRAFSKIR